MRLTDIVQDVIYVVANPLDYIPSSMFFTVCMAKEIAFQRVGWAKSIEHVFDWADPDFPAIASGWKCTVCHTVFFGSYTDDLRHECTDPK